MATKKLITKIVTQKMVSMDQTSLTVSKYPRYTVLLGNSISSITAGELTESVDKAAASAAAAKQSELNSKTSETNAKTSETKATEAANNSEASAKRSEAQVAEAAKQATAAEASAQKSSGFAEAAKTAAQNAEDSRRLADAAKTAAALSATESEASANEAKISETNAKVYETSASGSAEDAAASASAAKVSETNAAASATAAAGSATSAGSEALTAEQEADRAKAEADRAAQVVNGKLDSTDIAPFVKLYKTLEEAQADLTHRNVGERILVWSKTASKYGWYKVISGDTGKALSLELEEPRLLSVNNVQPDEAGNVQVTIPGGNPSLWLGEVTLFPYNKDSGVGYSGILPADGRLVLRVDYPDAWEAVDKGLVPSVTEEEWQAGAVMYFSRGTDDTNFRLPDMMRGQAFRAPVKNEEDAGEVKEQTPYVALVNKVAPDDTGNVDVYIGAKTVNEQEPDETGNVTIDIGVKTVEGIAPDNNGNVVGIAKSGDNRDITSLGALQAPVEAPDAAQDGQLVTLRQLKANMGGGSGSTTNMTVQGILGFIRWQPNRTYFQTHEVPADGQLLKREDYPEWWEEIKAQRCGRLLTEADWQGNAGNRGAYSSGDGTTTFRVPDLNGTQPGSIAGPTVRGDAGSSIGPASAGGVLQNAAPNITGRISTARASSGLVGPLLIAQAGAFTTEGTTMSIEKDFSAVGTNISIDPPRGVYTRFDASLVNAAYGRYNTDEVRMNTAIGVWVLTAKLGIVSDKNNFTIRNTVPTAPNGTIVTGGKLSSEANVATTNIGYSTSYFEKQLGITVGKGVWEVKDTGLNKLSRLDHTVDGELILNGIKVIRTGDTLNFGSLPQTDYEISSIRSGITGGKAYLRKFRGGSGDTIYHETVQGGTYRLAVGNTDNQTVFSVEHMGGTNVRGLLGDTWILKEGDYGLGSFQVPLYGNPKFPSTRTTFARSGGGSGSIPYGAGFYVRYDADLVGHLHISGSSGIITTRWMSGDTVQYEGTCWMTQNTTVDSNGFIKKASPIVKVFGDGQFETNKEAETAVVERLSLGVYRISGILSFSSDRLWGIEIPKDINGQYLLWVDYEVEPDGNLILKTFHRTNSNVPAFAQNIVEGYAEGDPIDIPAGRWVDVRVQMPAKEEEELPPTPPETEGGEDNYVPPSPDPEQARLDSEQNQKIESLTKQVEDLTEAVRILLGRGK